MIGWSTGIPRSQLTTKSILQKMHWAHPHMRMATTTITSTNLISGTTPPVTQLSLIGTTPPVTQFSLTNKK